MWSVCGDGDFGRDNDSIYANLIAHATDSESMAQIRNKLEDKGIDASSTPNEFNAVSSFTALNAEGTVIIATRGNLPKGQYLSEVELPILIRNPKVTRIEWINTSPEFLSQLENIATKAKTRQEFQDMSAELIESNKSTVFVRSECRYDLTDANAVNAIRDTIIEQTGGKSLTSETIKKQMDSFDKCMDSFDKCKEAENKLIPLNKEYGILKGEKDVYQI